MHPHSINTQRLSGWGNSPVESCAVWPLHVPGDAARIIPLAPSLIAYGGGRSYGDAALNPPGTAKTGALNSFIAVDDATGITTVEAGVTLRDVLDAMVPRGWFLPVIPGTQFATIGGALAANVHGKNHLRMGDFARHVLSFDLTLASGETVSCSLEINPELWHATISGLGMTGIIENVTLQLMPIQSARMEVAYTACDSIEAMLAQFEAQRDCAEYLVGWVDHFARGAQLGRGIVEAARHVAVADGSLAAHRPTRSALNVPFFAPSFTLNRYSMALYNAHRFRQALKTPTRTVGFAHFFHPLDGIGHWNRLYGKRGLLQYQFIVPDGASLRPILEALQQANQFSFLAVLKAHGEGNGLMGFSRPGYSLALDFPNTPAVHSLLDSIDQLVLAAGGRVYLAKDARLKRDVFKAMYAHALPQWRATLKAFDPTGYFMSSMGRRLGFKEYAS
ncbi:MAG: FAD-dependent oxidoreductase [Rickettsiales bacterium]